MNRLVIPNDDLPLFPLKAVLFPRMVVSLLVFEPRYLELIARCQEEGIGFGVALIKEGEEVGERAIPYSVGTVAQILEMQNLPNDQLQVAAMGVVRFRILRTLDSHPYLSADIERWEDDMGDVHALPRVTRAAHQLYKEYVAELAEMAGAKLPSDYRIAPDDPQILSYAIGVNLQIPAEEKQGLLEVGSVEERLRQEIALLEREREVLRRARSAREMQLKSAQPGVLPRLDGSSFSKN